MSITFPYEDRDRPISTAARAPLSLAPRTTDFSPAPIHTICPRLSARIRAHKAAQSKHPIGGWTKRAFDVTIASAIALAILPVLITIAVVVRLESPGPALFRQRRGGYRGKPFLVLKFRTMRTMDDGKSIQQAQRGDQRVTRVGAILRRTSLDELPQLFNVISGDMSLVGPRPHALAHDAHFATIDTSYKSRFRARPGITGLAQVSGARGETGTPESIRARTSYDLRYVRSWSFGSDVQILARTAFLVLGDRNAY